MFDQDELVHENLELKRMLYQVARKQSYHAFPKKVDDNSLQELTFTYDDSSYTLFVDAEARQKEFHQWQDEINELSIITDERVLEKYLITHPHMMESTLNWCSAIRQETDSIVTLGVYVCDESGCPSIEIRFDDEDYEEIIDKLEGERSYLDDDDITFEYNYAVVVTK